MTGDRQEEGTTDVGGSVAIARGPIDSRTPRSPALFVSECPLSALSLCHWRSDPLGTEDAAREALRGHVAVHRHGDLVEFAAAHAIDVVRYERSVTA